MTSVLSFFKQINTSDQVTPIANGKLGLPAVAAQAWFFQPGLTGLDLVNGVSGSSDDGYMVWAGDSTNANAVDLYGAIVNFTTGLQWTAPVSLRDMGKTRFAVISQAGVVLPQAGSFREVQLICQQPITYPQGFIGGVNGNPFGVYGGNGAGAGYTPYLTFYIPTTECGGYYSGPAGSFSATV
jgi:hypothetical protein